MAITRIDSQRKFAQGSLVGLHRDSRGIIALKPRNLWPNASGSETGADGEPAFWDLSWDVKRLIGHHVNVTKPGFPSSPYLARQSSTFSPLSEGTWVQKGPWVGGLPPSAIGEGSKPGTPEVGTMATGVRAWEPGNYMLAYGRRSKFGPTPTTGFVSFTLTAGQMPVAIVPDFLTPEDEFLDVYVTRKNAGPATAGLYGSYRVANLATEKIPMPGPLRVRGPAPTANRSGVPLPERPAKDDRRLVASGFATAAGLWRPGYQVQSPKGTTEWGLFGPVLKVEGDWSLVKRPGPGPKHPKRPANVQAADAMASARPENLSDPREVRPSGKHPDNEYLGQEIDFEESRLVSLINAERVRRGLPVLVLNAALNRAAENFTEPDEEGYRGRVAFSRGFGATDDVASSLLGTSDPLDAVFEAVGVARQTEGGATVSWRVFFGDDPELPADAAYSCDSFVVEHVEQDGTVYSSEVQSADARLSFDLVSNGRMDYSYNGSFDDAVRTGMGRIDAMGQVSVKPGGNQVAITDGALGGPMARTYSDGRIVYDASVMRSATDNARKAAVGHEGLHGLGFDHVSVASMLNTPIYVNRTTNNERPTAYDKSEYASVYGTGGGGSGDAPDGGTQSEEPYDHPEPERTERRRPPDEDPEPPEPEWHREWVQSPVRRNTALFLRPPRIVRRNEELRWAPIWQHTDLAGKVTTYRAYPTYSRQGTAAYFDDEGPAKNPKGGLRQISEAGVAVPGILPDDEVVGTNKQGMGPLARLVQEDFPTEDTTLLEPPDPSSTPDPPEKAGHEIDPEGVRAATVTGVLEDGSLTPQSNPARINVPLNHVLTVTPRATLNRLRAAEFRAKDSAGVPVDWQAINLNAATHKTTLDARDGTLYVCATSLTNSVLYVISSPIAVDPSRPLTLGGTLGLTRRGAGGLRISLRQLNASKTPLAGTTDTTLLERAALGESDFVETLPGARTLNPACAFVQLILSFTVNTHPTFDLDGYFRDLRVLDLPCDARRIGEGTFEPAPGTPLPADSYVSWGPAPTVGVPVAEEEPPLAFLDFEGTLDGWTASGIGVVSSVNPIHGTKSYLVERTSATQAQGGSLSRTFSDRVAQPMANRTLYRWDGLPTAGFATFHHFLAPGVAAIAWLRLNAFGVLFADVNDRGTVRTYDTGVRVTAGSVLDVEYAFVGGTQGLISLSVGLNGGRRTVAWKRGFNFSNASAHQVYAGVLSLSDPRALYSVTFDQVAVTKDGDVPDRERALSAGETGADPPDAPSRPLTPWAPKTPYAAGDERCPMAANAHLYRAQNAGRSGPTQPAFPTAAGVTVRDNAGLVAAARSTAYPLGACLLKPSGTGADAEWYEVTTAGTTDVVAPAYPTTDGATIADGTAVLTARKTVVWAEAGSDRRLFDFSGQRVVQTYALLLEGAANGNGPVTPENPALVPLLEDPIPVFPGQAYSAAFFANSTPFTDDPSYLRVWLETEDGSKEPMLALSVPLRGTRNVTSGWHPALEEDDWGTVVVPDGYHLAKPELALQPGAHVAQEFGLFEGSLTSFAARDAMRDGGSAANGSGEWVFDLVPEAFELGLYGAGLFLSEFGAKRAPGETETGTLTTAFHVSHDGITWLPYRDPPAEGIGSTEAKLRVRLNLSGGALVSDVYARTWQPKGALLRPDGTHFPGVVYVGDASSSEYPDVEVRNIGGRLFRVRKSADVERAEGIKVLAVTEQAKKEVEYLSAVGPLRLEIPGAGGTVPGTSYLILCGEEGLKLSPKGNSRISHGHRYYPSEGEIGYAEVLESAPNAPPMHLVSLTPPVQAGA